MQIADWRRMRCHGMSKALTGVLQGVKGMNVQSGAECGQNGVLRNESWQCGLGRRQLRRERRGVPIVSLG